MPTQFKWNHKSIEAWKPDREKTQIHPTSGLRLRGYPSGKKTWQWKRTRDKREFKDTLGAFSAFSLADANAWAVDLNAIFDRGDDPTAKAPEPAPEVERVTVEKAWEVCRAVTKQATGTPAVC